MSRRDVRSFDCERVVSNQREGSSGLQVVDVTFEQEVGRGCERECSRSEGGRCALKESQQVASTERGTRRTRDEGNLKRASERERVAY